MTTGTLDRPGILDRPDTIHKPITHKPITGDFEQAIIGYSMCFKCEWVHGCDNEVAWYGDLHGCEQAHICEIHMYIAVERFRKNLEEWGSMSCTHCKKKFTTWETWLTLRPI